MEINKVNGVVTIKDRNFQRVVVPVDQVNQLVAALQFSHSLENVVVEERRAPAKKVVTVPERKVAAPEKKGLTPKPLERHPTGGSPKPGQEVKLSPTLTEDDSLLGDDPPAEAAKGPPLGERLLEHVSNGTTKFDDLVALEERHYGKNTVRQLRACLSKYVAHGRLKTSEDGSEVTLNAH